MPITALPFLAQLAPTVLPALGGLFGKGSGQFGQSAGSLLGRYLGQLGSQTPFQKEAESAQMNLLKQLQQGQQFQPVDFAPIAAEQTRRFQQETIPSIAERFTGMGGQGSGAFRRALGGAGSDLASRLAALQAEQQGGQQQAQMQQQGLDLSRLSQLQGLLGGQQQLAQRQSEFGRELGLRQLGLAGQHQRTAQSPLEQLLRAGQVGLGQQYDVMRHPEQPGFAQALPQIITEVLKMAGYGMGMR